MATTNQIISLLFVFLVPFLLTSQDVGPEDKIISIYFGGGSYYIDYEQEEGLIQFIEDVEYLHEYQIEVHGHTDNVGSYEFNHYLSHMRCKSVIYLLTNMGRDEIQPELIFQYDHGEQSPSYTNETWMGKQGNRRVDVILRKHSI